MLVKHEKVVCRLTLIYQSFYYFLEGALKKANACPLPDALLFFHV